MALWLYGIGRLKQTVDAHTSWHKLEWLSQQVELKTERTKLRELDKKSQLSKFDFITFKLDQHINYLQLLYIQKQMWVMSLVESCCCKILKCLVSTLSPIQMAFEDISENRKNCLYRAVKFLLFAHYLLSTLYQNPTINFPNVTVFILDVCTAVALNIAHQRNGGQVP